MGTYTPNEYFYKPAYGASGETEMGKFHDALDGADAQIEANKKTYPVKWEGLGMGIFYTWGDAAKWDRYVDILLAHGFLYLRMDNNALGEDDWEADTQGKAGRISAIAKGAKIIWGVTAGGGTTLTAANWSDYSDAVLAAAAWAQANGVYEFSIGNEEENHNDDTTLTDTQLRANLRTLATAVQAVFTNGNITYSYAYGNLDAWISEGKGDIDLIAYNIPMSANFENRVDTMIAAFGADEVIFTEFYPDAININNYSEDEAVQAACVTEMIDYFKSKGIARAYYFCWEEPGWLEDLGVVKDDGTYRLLWNSLIGSELQQHAPITIGTTNGLSLDGQELSMAVADTDTTGALSSTDWDTFNNKSDGKLNLIYPQDYATGTGTSGDPWAGDCIDDAIAAASAGDTIYLRAGYYKLDGVCTINKALNIIGEGMGKTFVVTDTVHGFQSSGSPSYVTIKNLTIDGNSQVSGSYVCCISWMGDYAVFENLEIKNAHTLGIDYNSCNYGILNNIYAHDNGSHGVHPGTTTVGKNMHNTYKNIYAWNNGKDGFDDIGNQDNEDEDLYNVYDNLQCWDNTEAGISITTCRSCILSNSSASGNGIYGFNLRYIEDFNINNCVADNNGQDGILVTWSDKINFTNIIVRNNNKDEGAYVGIWVKDSQDIRFVCCQSYDDGSPKLQVYGLLASDTTDDIELTNCKLSGNLTGNINNTASATITALKGVVNGDAPVAGDIMIHNGTNWIRLAKGTAGQVLTMNGGATAPEWQTP